jgi:AraC-like DNA-binding protein
LTDDGENQDVRTLALSFHAGTLLAEHQHRWGQLVFAASGVMQVITGAAAWFIPSTRAIWLPAGMAHSIRMQGEVSLRTLYLNASRAAPLPIEPAVLEVVPLLRELILHIVSIGMLTPEQPQHDRLASVLVDLLCHAHSEDLMLPLPQSRRAAKLAEILLHAPGDERDLPALASEVGASLRTLQREFPHETGLTIEAWRQKARMIHAVAMLSTGTSVSQTALDCGYLSLAAFSSAFRRQFGASPGRYRLRQRR